MKGRSLPPRLFALVSVGFFLLTAGARLRAGEATPPAPAERLKAHVDKLAGEIGDRSEEEAEALKASEVYVYSLLKGWGYAVERQPCHPGARIRKKRGGCVGNNVVATKPGEPGQPEILVGAHYDTAENPGADDNASGVAMVLELARALRDFPNRLTVRFVLFANEESPFNEGGTMGSEVYARTAKARQDRIRGVMVLDGVGFYPEGAHYACIGSDKASMPFATEIRDLFARASAFPLKIMRIGTEGYDESDHYSFWEKGYRGVMIISSANDGDDEHYHSPADTPDTLDYPNMARLLEGLTSVLEALLR